MLTMFKNYIISILKKEDGQGLVEYALIIGLVAVVVIAALILLGGTITTKFNEIVTALTGH